ncbi:elongation factor G [candidate division KSB1 bacterium]|nr:elongation factor G [candidate division KSB1 bacterium]RQW00174.1 MAG: elongation factor G [candidate division KSB1 bacterium]
MKEYGPQDIRNIGLVSHQSVGKTTLSEAMLYAAGLTNRFGTIDDGTTISDYRSDEIERKISIGATLMHFEWKKSKVNLIDLPGYADFFGEVRCGLRVTDLAIVLVNGIAGVEVGTDTANELLDEFETPRLFFINLLDREHAKFDEAFASIKEGYGNNVIAFQFPINQGEGYNAVIDLLRMKKLTFVDDKGTYNEEGIPAELADRAEELHMELIEKIAECDDAIMEKYLETMELSDTDVVTGLRAGLVKREIYPVFCGAASKNVGVQSLLDFIDNYGPSPIARSPYRAQDGAGNDIQIACDEKSDFSALTFKTISEQHVGELSLIRVYSGSIKSGDEVLNTTRGNTEKIGQIYALNGKTRSEMNRLIAGDIGALVKLKDTHTGDTLAFKKTPVKFLPIQFAEPVFQLAVSPKSKGDEEKIGAGLHILNEIDPSFTITLDPELKQTVVSGQGELHLTIVIQRLKERFGVDVEKRKPKIPYRETVTTKADDKYRHKKQSGGAGQFAEVWMRIEPLPRGTGFEFASEVVGGAISHVFIPSVEKGVKQVMQDGAIAGHKIVDVKAIVYDGKEHPVDSKDIAFQIAGRQCFKLAMQKAKPILLEPIYDVEVKCPEKNMGDVMGDLSTRRGKIAGMESQGRFQLLKAKVPLAELHDYATKLRSMTAGRASYTRTFSHYDPVPKDIEAKIIAEHKSDAEE